jgi:predicted dehydrogenase/threonine dehydrogenase-like Zn-dependent dehydrogenase
MKQVLQQPRTGEVTVAEVPAPPLTPGCVLVRIAASLVSAGTERAVSEFASKSLVEKAKARPDLVRAVLDKVRRDGVLSAVEAVRVRLDQPTALGYSSAGTVVGVGNGVRDLAAGDRVACAGAGYAVHAEVASVPRLLVAKIPEGVSFEEAAFTTVGAVALHGIRQAEVRLGDLVAVIGLGLLGQLTVQTLKAAGCRVLGMDIAQDRADLALRLGALATSVSASEFHELCLHHTHGFGVDAVMIAAETASSEPVNLAGQVARDRAVVVAVGTVGMDIERKAYYEKELDFRLSRSYGPGRYDEVYELKGRDYPIGYVRWTETRNMEGFLRLVADGKLEVKPLITHRYPLERAPAAYDLIMGKTRERFLSVLFTYPEQIPLDQRLQLVSRAASPDLSPGTVRVGLLGAGSFATGTLLPAMKRVGGVDFAGVCAATGAHSRHAADKFGFRYCTTDENQVVGDSRINTVVISTRHHLHARQVLASLAAGKNVFCEKPLCLREEELAEIVRAYLGTGETPRPVLMVGFNRRFAPLALRMKNFLAGISDPLTLHYRVNAGFLPPDHWLNDPEQGGGRILGEVCHFVDFLSFLAGSRPGEVQTLSAAAGQTGGDSLVVAMKFANGAQGTISYLTGGDKSYSKERVEVLGGGAIAVLEDFRRLELVRNGRRQTVRSRWQQDKGHQGEWAAFAASIRGSQPPPIPLEEIVATTLATLKIVESRTGGRALDVDTPGFIQAAARSPFSSPCPESEIH